ncbi:MAG: Asp-tRNA(Asn)/Glu-tRNA(Gln) amidotransferase subunit GatA [Alphaproteobacteria bacterium]|nr:Asp-tRNA(Asn)/Glu-tRNA(Gln) amidotransferase subunit GatA [Alphaproteobacteria bacterium]
MPGSELAFLPVSDIARLMANGAVSPVSLTQYFLDRIDKYDAGLHAFITVMGRPALAAAARAEDAASSGPLWGIPFACKDMIQARGAPTTAGSAVLADWMPEADATVVERMTAAGAILIGKNNLHEFAYGAMGENAIYGTPPNPFDRERLAGGSSSGSAAAVAAGLVPAAIGTDTGGSVRVPAALCGLVGLKPTLGRISTYGIIPFAWTLDHVGLLTRTIEDSALLLEILSGFDPRDSGSVDVANEDSIGTPRADVAGLKVGVPRRFFYERADPEILDATDRALATLEKAGATCIEIELPAMDHARTVSLTIQLSEALSYHSRYLETGRDAYGEDLLAGLAAGQFILAEHYVRARRFVQQFRESTNLVFETADIIVTPTTPFVAPMIGTTEVETDGLTEAVGNGLTRYTTFFNMSGHPAVSMPAGLHSTGLPMGVQIVGRHFEEKTILGAGAVIEREPDFAIPMPKAFLD